MYYGTYSNSKAFVVPSDIEVSEVGVTDGKLALTAYNTGDVVPANTGVLITALEAGDYIVDYSAAAGTSVLGSDNKLKASGDAGISAEDMNEANTKFYRLTMHDGSKLGFWWGAEEGTAFDIAANKAYLAVPDIQAANVQGFVFGDETTGLSEELRVKSEEFAPVVYDLQGRRVAQTAKGLYIVNGKKVIIK